MTNTDITKGEEDFFTYAQGEIDRLTRLNRLSTASNRNSSLRRFFEYREGKVTPFTIITPTLLEDFEAAMQAKGCCRNTTSFHLRNLRSIYNQAARDGRFAPGANPFATVYTGIDTTRKRALNLRDLIAITTVDLSHRPSMEKARDLFTFSLITRGMSFIDMAFLRKCDVKGGMLSYRRHKTGQLIVMHWEDEMQRTVDRHSSTTGYLLPIIRSEDGTERRQYKNAMMHINRQLKVIASLAHIDATVSIYTARHSWATLARDQGVSIPVISKALGHDSEITTRIYLASVSTEDVDRANKTVIDAVFKGHKP